ncbi:AGE2 [Candida margitis]|uniref:AGE2 n=1 Tax=Candida margitis TaxID=1775924 RepID=UPI002226B072|nr:AGE2 [Candida margitis]KAI5950569.1 AGE2 [Candida margitis]
MSYRTSSSTGALPSSKKTHSERHKQILKQLLKEEPNRSCADCKINKNPRWASWNLGCFICIRCSGIHRSMGTHISKVKSVDLDAWTDDQIENIVQWGNDKCNGFWEAKLPEGYIPDQSKIENFIRTKYDLKKWCLSSTIPNPATIKGKPTTSNNNNNNGTTSNNASTNNSHQQNASHLKKNQTAPTPKSGSLLDDEFGLFTSHKSSSPVTTTTAAALASTTPAQARTPPISGRATSATPASAPESRSTQQLQSAQSTGGSISSNSRPDLKKSILSLYASPSASNSFIQPQQQQNKADSSVNSLSDSLAGLQFQSSNSTSNLGNGNNNYSGSAGSAGIYNKPQAQSTGSLNATMKPLGSSTTAPWNSEWNDSSSSSYATTTPKSNINVTLDDDLFKNVWS